MNLREEVRWLGEHYQASQQRICGLMERAVSSYRYRGTRSDAGLRERLVELAWKKPRFGYRRLHVLLVGSGEDFFKFAEFGEERRVDAGWFRFEVIGQGADGAQTLLSAEPFFGGRGEP